VGYDRVLKGGTLADGSGRPAFQADVALLGATIAEVGPSLSGGEEIDVSGHVVAPGFIDTHSHSDLMVLSDPTLPMKLRQGITLEVLGQDGISVAPVHAAERTTWKQKLSGLLGDFGVVWDWTSVDEYLGRISAGGTAQDIAYAAPHGAIRQLVMGGGDRRATQAEIARMQALVASCLEEGACGLSNGLIYPPCSYADTQELVALGRTLAGCNKPLVVHMRSESDRILEAVREMIEVASVSGCAVHISHLKIAGRENWCRANEMVELLEGALAKGLRLTADQYPYNAGSTLLGAILPPWAHDGGTEATLRRLSEQETRLRLRRALADPARVDWDNFWKWSGPDGIVVSDIPSGRHQAWIGKNLAQIAHQSGRDPFDTAFDLLLEERMGVAMVSFSQDESIVERFLKLPFVNVCTDGLLGGRPHPRAYGTYPRILGRHVRERGTLSLVEAVRKMTSQAASAFGFSEVGLVQKGLRGNLVVFDPETILDRATYEEPLQFPDGVRDVLVGGDFVIRDGTMTNARPGKVVS